MTQPQFKKIVIFGVGLIGGSFALALRKAHAVGEVVGFGRSAQTLAQARQLGIIDRIGQDVAAEVGDADLVLLATPVGQMAESDGAHRTTSRRAHDGHRRRQHQERRGARRLRATGQQGGAVRARPSHRGSRAERSRQRRGPICIQGKKVVLTPLPENSAAVGGAGAASLAELAARMVSELTQHEHDEVFAAVSHLPHLLSFALVHDLAQARQPRPAAVLCRQRLPRLHPHRGQLAGNVARHLPGESRCPAERIADLHRRTDPDERRACGGDTEKLEQTFRAAHAVACRLDREIMIRNLSDKRLWWLIIAFAAVWFANLEYRKLIKPDEGRYAEIPREMVASGDWTTPRLNGLKYFEKPPLQYWATATAYTVFGEHQWTSRLWTALTGFAGILLVWFAGSRLFGREAAQLCRDVAGQQHAVCADGAHQFAGHGRHVFSHAGHRRPVAWADKRRATRNAAQLDVAGMGRPWPWPY